ncbi:bola domain protein [Acrodontium crateriforme]|uniref:Bola domain protein n=1 Tax=Acrodontium crateriforme TaxID=150365 RepID=A0AAQ3LZ49_9PEZI|nr:bola domain protein [Acrodontium crateriforme]
MFRRILFQHPASRRSISNMSSSSTTTTPMEHALRTKLTESLAPSKLEIFNDSHLHSHHKAMQGVTSKETHFRVYVTSEAFKSKMQPARHRMVYALMEDELAMEGGIHALQLRTRTPEEQAKADANETSTSTSS